MAQRYCFTEQRAYIVEPVGDEVFVAGVEDVGVVGEQNRGPLGKVALRNKVEAPSFERVGNVFAGDDDAGLGDAERSVGSAAVAGADQVRKSS